MVNSYFSNKDFKWIFCIVKKRKIKITWVYIDMFVSDTVEAFESGELVKLLGITGEDKNDLWIKNKPLFTWIIKQGPKPIIWILSSLLFSLYSLNIYIFGSVDIKIES